MNQKRWREEPSVKAVALFPGGISLSRIGSLVSRFKRIRKTAEDLNPVRGDRIIGLRVVSPYVVGLVHYVGDPVQLILAGRILACPIEDERRRFRTAKPGCRHVYDDDKFWAGLFDF